MPVTTKEPAAATAIRPFAKIEFPEAELKALRARIEATRWPEKETVKPVERQETKDQSQGVQLVTMQKLAKYWATDYDWRRCEARLNALPHFVTEIDGLDIHFIHVRSKHDDALPLIVTHGWPGSVIEQLKIVEPLTNPTAHGGSASDAFHLVIPSMPGFGFSGKPTTTGWGPDHIASAWIELMRVIGYKRFVAQGGDWGALIVDLMGVEAPRELLGIHTNMPGTVPPEIDKAALTGAPAPDFPPRRRKPTTSSRSSIRSTWPTRRRWGPAPRRCTGSPIHRSAWPHGSSTTMRAASSSSRGSSTESLRALRETMCSTTSRSSG